MARERAADLPLYTREVLRRSDRFAEVITSEVVLNSLLSIPSTNELVGGRKAYTVVGRAIIQDHSAAL